MPSDTIVIVLIGFISFVVCLVINLLLQHRQRGLNQRFRESPEGRVTTKRSGSSMFLYGAILLILIAVVNVGVSKIRGKQNDRFEKIALKEFAVPSSEITKPLAKANNQLEPQTKPTKESDEPPPLALEKSPETESKMDQLEKDIKIDQTPTITANTKIASTGKAMVVGTVDDIVRETPATSVEKKRLLKQGEKGPIIVYKWDWNRGNLDDSPTGGAHQVILTADASSREVKKITAVQSKRHFIVSKPEEMQVALMVTEKDALVETANISVKHPYSVFLGSYQSWGEAQKLVESYNLRGVPSYWARVDLGTKGIWYRVFCGHFTDKILAEKYIKKQRLKPADVRNTPYAVFLGKFGSKTDVTHKQLTFSDRGWSTYFIGNQEGQYHLYLGAFHTKVGAKQQILAIEDENIEKQIVQR